MLLKIIFRASVSLIVLLLIILIIWPFQPLEFTKSEYADNFKLIPFLGLPVLILLTLTGTLKKKNSIREIVAKIFVTIFTALLPLVILFATALDGMCQWNTTKDLFENITDPSTKIVLRDFGCGATDSTSPTYQVFEITNYTSYFMRINPVDTNKIDKAQWKRIN